MINNYKHISIIYGDSGLRCAKKIEEKLMAFHTERCFPIKTHILANSILNGEDVLKTVKSIIQNSSACIIILTFDDVNETRVRQNVLIEIGMALMMIDQEKCYFLTERYPLPDDFPSDLSTINPNLFDKNDLEKTAKAVSNTIINDLCLKGAYSGGILFDKNYQYDYTRILDDIPAEFTKVVDNSALDKILDIWENNIKSFDYVTERIIYFLERFTFLPNFAIDDKFFSFLKYVNNLLKPTDYDRDFCKINNIDGAPVNEACSFTRLLIDYLKCKYEHNQKGKASTNQDKRILAMSMKSIKNKICEFTELDYFKDYNWIIQIMAYDYKALASTHIYDDVDVEDEMLINSLYEAVDDYKMCLNIVRNDSLSSELWNGYIYYNLARVYEKLYLITGIEENLIEMRNCIDEACYWRGKTFKDNCFDGAFSAALTYEFFMLYRYKYQSDLKYSENINKEELIGFIEDTRSKLKDYCGNSDFARLYQLNLELTDLIEEIKEKIC